MAVETNTSLLSKAALGRRLHEIVLSWEAAVDRWAASGPLVIGVFTIIYALPTIRFAAQKLFWDDEFYTLYLSTVSSWHELLRALATGADQHPPTFYYLTHLSVQLFGCTPVTVRLPAIFGVWIMCVALYALCRRLFSPIWGVVAMMLALTSGAYYYGSEARGYGLVLGFSALALYAWLELTAARSRAIFLAVLAISSAAAVASHYYAAIAIVALGAGEVVRTIIRKRLDVPVWAAFACSAIPLLAFRSTIRSAAGYSTHFWARPIWTDVFRFYANSKDHVMFGFMVAALWGSIGVAVVLTVALPRCSANDDNAFPMTRPSIAAIAVLAISPLSAMILAKFVTHGFTDRYAIVALLGTIILATYAISAIGRRRTAVAVLAILICGLCFYINQRNQTGANQGNLDVLMDDFQLLNGTHGAPVALMAPNSFHRLSFYSPPSLYHRLSYVADPDASIKYLREDTVDQGFLSLRPWFPLQIVPLREYVKNNSYFLAFGDNDIWSWLSYRLPALSVETRLLARRNDELLFAVKTAAARANDGNPEIIEKHPGLSSKFIHSGRSLCESYFGASHCPVL